MEVINLITECWKSCKLFLKLNYKESFFFHTFQHTVFVLVPQHWDWLAELIMTLHSKPWYTPDWYKQSTPLRTNTSFALLIRWQVCCWSTALGTYSLHMTNRVTSMMWLAMWNFELLEEHCTGIIHKSILTFCANPLRAVLINWLCFNWLHIGLCFNKIRCYASKCSGDLYSVVRPLRLSRSSSMSCQSGRL